jgi:hypothetical protein
MKKLFTLSLVIILTFSGFAQVPQKMSYQCVVRNASGVLVTNMAIGIRIGILQGSATGTAAYVETQKPTTNANGLATIEIGSGTVVRGTFAGINWATDVYFIKTETDPDGGTSYTITGTSQILSVPYALYAKTSETSANAVTITGDNIIAGTKTFTGTITVPTPVNPTDAATKAYVDNSEKHYIGESYGGGIVFYVYDDGRHGLIAATADQGTTWVIWTNTAFQSIVSNAVRDGVNGGLTNTERIIIQAGAGSYAAQLCANYKGGNYADWYLPSEYELNLLYLQKAVVGGFASSGYWSSTEANNANAWA